MASLRGKIIDPSHLAPEWESFQSGEGYEVIGKLTTRMLDRDEMFEMDCFDLGDVPGMFVIVEATVRTDRAYRILDVDTYAYASSGPCHGRPESCGVTRRDNQVVAEAVARMVRPSRPRKGDSQGPREE